MSLTEEDLQEIRFTVVKGANPGSRISFKPGTRSVRIGRAVENEIVISDPTVSRSHARVDIRTEGCFIVDAGSASGVEKMGFRVGREPERLQSGDEFRLGDTILKFEVVAKKGALKKAAAREAAPAESGPRVSPVQAALRRIGLRTKTTQLGAAVLLVALLAVFLWPSTPGLPPQSDEPLAINYAAAFGFNNVDSSHLDRATFEVPTDAEGVALYFEILPVSGVELRGETRPIARIEPSVGWTTYELMTIPRAMAVGKKKPLLIFDNLGYSREQGDVDPSTVKPWAVKSMWVARMRDTASSPAQLAEELEALRSVYDRLTDDPANRYALLKGLRHALLGLMKQGGRFAVLVALPSPESMTSPVDVGSALDAARAEIGDPNRAMDRLLPGLREIEGELNRDYRKQINLIALARKKGSVPEELAALQGIAKAIPDATDPRHRQAVSELQRFGVQDAE